MAIPYELVAKIVSAADVPIDTFVAFLPIGAVPKRVVVPPHLQEKLLAIHVRRASLWNKRGCICIENRGCLEKVEYQIAKDRVCTFTVFHGRFYQWAWERRSLTGVGCCTHSYDVAIFTRKT